MQLEIDSFSQFGEGIVTADSHTAGEPTRLVVGGLPPLPGATINEKRLYVKENLDGVRRRLTREPRGHRDMFAAIATEPVSAEADFGLIYMDARRYPYMCGHATIGAITTFLEMGWLAVPDGAATHEAAVDTPSGLVRAEAALRWQNGRPRATAVTMQLIPSFVQATGQTVTLPNGKAYTVEIVCVGGYFVMVSADQIDLTLTAADAPALAELGMALIAAAHDPVTIRHPTRPNVNTIDVTEIYQQHKPGEASRSAVIYGESHVDRSPCGTGTAAKMALFHHQGALAAGEELRSEGLRRGDGAASPCFLGRIVGEAMVGDKTAVIPQIQGSAHLTGLHRFIVRADDPFPDGFLF